MSADIPPARIICPGCGRPLHVPPEAVGKLAHCPHCQVNFFLPANPDGSPGEPRVATPRSQRFGVPRALIGPGFALLIMGGIGCAVYGFLLAKFLTVPDADLDYARLQVLQMRDLERMGQKPGEAGETVEPPGAAPLALSEEDEALAHAWASGMVPIHAVSLTLSALTVAGGLATLAGRFYPLALLGCAAAALNVNNFCCVPGGAAGLWGVLMLVRDENRRHFGLTPKV